MADRDPEAVKRDIDVAREELASTVDSLAERANPRRLADDLKARVIGFVQNPAVMGSLAGPGPSSWWRSSAGSGIAGTGAALDMHRPCVFLDARDHSAGEEAVFIFRA